ncbi:MAG: asparagine synthase (glutamine-hydrolyzing) [Acidobacteria bacterium]|nr:asparagine synthase (glutamine-hydrolyzing) [Acidobacteriota bacterium]
MCGIAGIMHFDGAPVPVGLADQMGAALRHRGPDDGGVVSLPTGDAGGDARARGALVSRRLSIIDVEGGHQPISNEDGTVWTVLNGEIYNFAELRTRLEGFGHRFSTRSDTEVIVHAYEQWGDECLKHLDGMFALALWDARAERLLLARDRFGKKPLLYFDDGARIAFASEFQSLLCVPDVPRDIDTDALGSYLAYMAVPAPRTIYARVRKVPPAHAVTRDRAGLGVQRYWTLAFQPKIQIGEDAAVEQVQYLLRAAVRKRLVGEVPLGAFLSGGVDSSAVVAMMADAASQPVKTFSIGFEHREYDELPHARRAAEAFGCEHHEFIVTPSMVDILPEMVRHFGEPFADSSAVPSWYLARLTRAHVTVALSGDGGDEVFAGYGRHLANDLAERWQGVPGPVRRSAERVARSRLLADLGGSRLARFAGAAASSRAARYRLWAGVFSGDMVRELSDLVPAHESTVPAEFERASGLDAVDAVLAVDSRLYLPSDLLVKVDISSMAHSLEVRSPFLDTALAEFVASLPSGMKLHRLTTKHLLKRAVAGRVPPQNLRRAKRGFAVPIGDWMRDDLRSFLCDHLQPSRMSKAGIVRQSAIDRLIGEHLSRRADHAHHLWVLLMLEVWWRTCLTA